MSKSLSWLWLLLFRQKEHEGTYTLKWLMKERSHINVNFVINVLLKDHPLKLVSLGYMRKRAHKCFICNVSFSNKTAWTVHIEAVHEGKNSSFVTIEAFTETISM